MKIKSILISQPKPVDITKTPYDNIIKKFNVNIEFEKFIRLEDVSASELRSTLTMLEVIVPANMVIDLKVNEGLKMKERKY